jgi:amino acid transporter
VSGVTETRTAATAVTTSSTAPRLHRALGFRDLLLFYIVTTFSLRWIATAAAAGPSALVIWLIAAAGLFVPLVFATLELSSRYPEEGGIYVWSKQAFGPFAAFITGWSYWTTNLPYFPSILYFAAGNALFVGGPSWQAWSSNSAYFMTASMIGLTFAVTLNVVGVDIGKWLSNIGAISAWIPAGLLIVLGAVSWARFGSATPMNAAAFIPSTSLKDVIFWSTIAFAFGGVESASSMGEEIRDPRRTLPHAILAAAVVMTLLYLAGTFSVLLAIPREQISGLQGIMQAVQTMTAKVGVGWLAPFVAVMITVNALGGVGGWFAATARLPFVAGIDRFLPRAFGRLHPRFHTPHVALLVQAGISAVFVVLGQAGTSVHGAYDVLVSMSVISYFVPFLFMFAALIRVQGRDVDADVMRVPGGAPMAIALGALGFLTTTIAIGLACVPAADEPNKPLAVAKIVGLSVLMLGLGAAVYAIGRRRARAADGPLASSAG